MVVVVVVVAPVCVSVGVWREEEEEGRFLLFSMLCDWEEEERTNGNEEANMPVDKSRYLLLTASTKDRRGRSPPPPPPPLTPFVLIVLNECPFMFGVCTIKRTFLLFKDESSSGLVIKYVVSSAATGPSTGDNAVCEKDVWWSTVTFRRDESINPRTEGRKKRENRHWSNGIDNSLDDVKENFRIYFTAFTLALASKLDTHARTRTCVRSHTRLSSLTTNRQLNRVATEQH